MKEKFIEFVEKLMSANPDLVEKIYNEDAKAYFEAFKTPSEESKTVDLTENGRNILKIFQDYVKMDGSRKGYKSSDIANALGVATRNVSGTIRKLINDGYIEKVDDTKPIIYLLTEKGLKYNLD